MPPLSVGTPPEPALAPPLATGTPAEPATSADEPAVAPPFATVEPPLALPAPAPVPVPTPAPAPAPAVLPVARPPSWEQASTSRAPENAASKFRIREFKEHHRSGQNKVLRAVYQALRVKSQPDLG